jgi:WD40 repeat protein
MSSSLMKYSAMPESTRSPCHAPKGCAAMMPAHCSMSKPVQWAQERRGAGITRFALPLCLLAVVLAGTACIHDKSAVAIDKAMNARRAEFVWATPLSRRLSYMLVPLPHMMTFDRDKVELLCTNRDSFVVALGTQREEFGPPSETAMYVMNAQDGRLLSSFGTGYIVCGGLVAQGNHVAYVGRRFDYVSRTESRTLVLRRLPDGKVVFKRDVGESYRYSDPALGLAGTIMEIRNERSGESIYIEGATGAQLSDAEVTKRVDRTIADGTLATDHLWTRGQSSLTGELLPVRVKAKSDDLLVNAFAGWVVAIRTPVSRTPALASCDDLNALPITDASGSRVSLSPDGSMLAVGGRGGMAMWNLRTRQETWSSRAEGFVVEYLAFCASGSRLLVAGNTYADDPGGNTHIAKVMEANTGRELSRMNCGRCPISTAAVSADGSLVALDCSSGREPGLAEPDDPGLSGLSLWSVGNGSPLEHIGRLGGLVLCFHPDGKHLLTQDGLRDVPSLRPARYFKWPEDRQMARSLAVSPDGGSVFYMVPGSLTAVFDWLDQGIYEFNVESGKLLRVIGKQEQVFPKPPSAGDSPIALSDKLLVAGADRQVRLWDLTSGEAIGEAECDELIASISVSAKGGLVVAATNMGKLYFWRVPRGPTSSTAKAD